MKIAITPRIHTNSIPHFKETQNSIYWLQSVKKHFCAARLFEYAETEITKPETLQRA